MCAVRVMEKPYSHVPLEAHPRSEALLALLAAGRLKLFTPLGDKSVCFPLDVNFANPSRDKISPLSFAADFPAECLGSDPAPFSMDASV